MKDRHTTTRVSGSLFWIIFFFCIFLCGKSFGVEFGKLVFVHESDIYVMDVDDNGNSSNPTHLTADLSGGQFDPRWSPDGQKIAFRLHLNSNEAQIWTMNADGTQKQRLTNSSGYYDQRPAWSPDGNKIAFMRSYGMGTCPAYATMRLCIMQSDGSGLYEIPIIGGHGEYSPEWSPDGTTILYNRDEGTCSNPYDLYKMHPDGTGKHLVYPPPGRDMDWMYQAWPRWGTNGRIAFSEMTGTWDHWEIGVINADGTGHYLISHTGVDSVRLNCWAFNNTKIIYTASTGSEGRGELWMVNIDGTGRTRIQSTLTGVGSADFKAAPPTRFLLTTAIAGAGTGMITSSPSGILCSATCTGEFNSGTQVTVAATADPGSTFESWQGCDSSSGNVCLVSMNAARTVTATFQECSYNLTPTNVTMPAPGGTGIIAVTASSRDCTGTWTAQSNDSWITIPSEGPRAGSGSVGYAVSENRTASRRTGTITAAGQIFTVIQLPPDQHSLSVTVSGQGTISSEPAGINCGTDCSEPFPHGTVVTLMALPSAGFSFDGWSGGCSGTTPCTVTVNEDTTVSAAFSAPVTVKLDPQVLMAGFDPILLDLTTTRVRVMALVREGNQSIAGVSITDNIGSISFAMNRMGRLSNGDLLYGAELSIDRGPGFSVPNLFGSGTGQILIKAVDALGLSHSFPTVAYGNNPDLISAQNGTDAPLYEQQGCRRLLPQVLMAGIEPAILDFDDTDLQVRAIVRQGARPIQDVILKTNNGALSLSMDFAETLANGDRLYEKTVIFPRGSFGSIESNFENLWGGMNNQFMIQVRDDAGQTHSFPDLRRGDYRTINPTECWSDQ